MKATFLLAFILLLYNFPSIAQNLAKSDTIVPANGNTKLQLEKIKTKKTRLHSDVIGNEPKKSILIDTTIQNKYGDLLNNDPEYNKRYPLWKSFLGVPGGLILTWSFDRYILKADYSRIGLTTWKGNIKDGWEWDNDRFGINFIGHPYSGAFSFNAGRTTGYNFYESFGFSVGGSLLWEYFGENTRPSYNDLINTPISGAFLGEILYRISSNILDDRTRGRERILREIAAALIDPKRGFNRLIMGKTKRVTNKEIYQKEPLNVAIYSGLHRINDESMEFFGKGSSSVMLNIQLDYGNPFEIRSRKAYDFFKIRGDLSFGVGRKFVDDITGYGILFGKNMQVGKVAILAGGFQYYDYLDNKTFELGTIGFGGGIFSKLPIGKETNLYTNLHLAIVPLAGNSTRFGPDTSQLRDYNFGGGFEGKLESTLSLGKHATASLLYYFYMIHTYVGAPGNNQISILKPRITVRLFRGLSIGAEHFVYLNNRYLTEFPAIHAARTEEKVFLLLYLEDPQRRGHYN